MRKEARRPVLPAQRHSNVSRKSRKAAGQSLMRLCPDAQRAVRGSPDKVLVRREQRKFVTNTELCEQRIDSADLHPAATAAVSQLRGIDVVLAVGRNDRQRGESIDADFACTRTSKPLQQFLQDQSRGHNGFVALQGVAKHRSEEHTSELQSPDHLVCRLLLEKKNTLNNHSLISLNYLTTLTSPRQRTHYSQY